MSRDRRSLTISTMVGFVAAGMHCHLPSSGAVASKNSCCQDLPVTGGCLHSHPAKRLKLRPQIGRSANRSWNHGGRGFVCVAHGSSQANATAVAERPTEAPASSIPVQLLTSSKSPELLRIRHSVSALCLRPSCKA